MKHIINLFPWVIIVLPCLIIIGLTFIFVFLWNLSWKKTVKIMDKLDNKFYHPVITEFINKTYEFRFIPVLTFIILLSSCADRYNVQLKDGSIVEVHNEINSYDYHVDDTVGVQYSSSYEEWYISEEMKDTTTFYGGYNIKRRDSNDSIYIPINYLKYRIGVIK